MDGYIKIRGFTLPEMMMVMLIVASLATLAMPRLVETMEKARASEAEEILYVLLASQKRLSVDQDNGDAIPDYTNNIDALDVTIDLSSYFDPPTVDSANPIAQIERNDGTYTLFIADTAVITCADTGSNICKRLGY